MRRAGRYIEGRKEKKEKTFFKKKDIKRNKQLKQQWTLKALEKSLPLNGEQTLWKEKFGHAEAL